MEDSKKYWRDIVMDLLKWGTAVFLLFVGWAASGHYEIFKISKGGDHRAAGIGLLIATGVYACLIPLAIIYIYKNHLKSKIDKSIPQNEIDKTILSKGFVLGYTCFTAALSITVACLMVFY